MNEFWIDECFQVKQNITKLWYSEDKNGIKLITSPNEVSCISATRLYLKKKQEGDW